MVDAANPRSDVQRLRFILALYWKWQNLHPERVVRCVVSSRPPHTSRWIQDRLTLRIPMMPALTFFGGMTTLRHIVKKQTQ